MPVLHSSLSPLPLDIICSHLVCSDVGTPCLLPWAPLDLVPYCIIFSEVMRAGRTFVPGPPPWEVTFSRLMCSGVRETRMVRLAGLGVKFPCSPAWVLGFGLHPLAHPLSGLWEREVRQKDRSLSGPLSRSLTLIAFAAAGNVSLAQSSQVMCAEVAPVVPLWAPCDLGPWCITFSEVMRVGSGSTFVP